MMHLQRVVSLADMAINASMTALVHVQQELSLQITVASHNRKAARLGLISVPEEMNKSKVAFEQVVESVTFIDQCVDGFRKFMPSPHVDHAMKRIKHCIRSFEIFDWDDLFYKLCTLRDSIETEITQHLIYVYPKNEGERLKAWKNSWSAVLKQWPETEVDAFCAVDLLCMGHATASVYHSMRVLETGLGSISEHIGVTYEHRNWYNVINDIESRISEKRRTMPKSVREDVLNFYSTVAKEFSYFKDGWRNYASHARCVYDNHQAASVLEHTCSFMTFLAAGFPDVPHDLEAG